MLVKRFVRSVPPAGIPARLVKMVIVTPGLHLSTAVGVSKTQSVPHSTSLLGRQTRFGGSVSTIVTVWLQKVVLLQESLTRQVRVALNSLGHIFAKLFVTSNPVT